MRRNRRARRGCRGDDGERRTTRAAAACPPSAACPSDVSDCLHARLLACLPGTPRTPAALTSFHGLTHVPNLTNVIPYSPRYRDLERESFSPSLSSSQRGGSSWIFIFAREEGRKIFFFVSLGWGGRESDGGGGENSGGQSES